MKCARCEGTGQVPSGIISPALGPVPAACPACDGTGDTDGIIGEHKARSVFAFTLPDRRTLLPGPVYIAQNLLNFELLAYSTQKDAAEDCIRRNRAGPDHPAFQLFRFTPRGDDWEREYIGRLWRPFGCDFDPANPWNPTA